MLPTPPQIKSAIANLLESASEGMHSSEIIKGVRRQLPNATGGQVVGQLGHFRSNNPKNNIRLLSRGLYRHIKFQSDEDFTQEQKYESPIDKFNSEINFYQPFADYLMDEGECTKAIRLGGNKFGSKWGTPDVIGVNRSGDFERIKRDTEILSAEIKVQTDGPSLIIAFGQACAYRLFSHKVYLVIPETSPRPDIDRVESLCLIFGIGLILFNLGDHTIGTFKIRTRAIKHEPDFSYVNENVDKIAKDLLGN